MVCLKFNLKASGLPRKDQTRTEKATNISFFFLLILRFNNNSRRIRNQKREKKKKNVKMKIFNDETNRITNNKNDEKDIVIVVGVAK